MFASASGPPPGPGPPAEGAELWQARCDWLQGENEKLEAKVEGLDQDVSALRRLFAGELDRLRRELRQEMQVKGRGGEGRAGQVYK